MKVSVVTPTFNAVRYLPDCVASVRHAFSGMDYEHIVADGGSRDGTVDFLQQQDDLIWFSEPDNGMYDALNKAIARASGAVIGHLNADEQYNRPGLHAAVDALATSGADAVFGPTVLVDAQGRFLQLFKQIVTPRVVDTHWCMPVQSCSLLYRRACWERASYDTRYRLVADHAWFRRQMEMGMRLVHVREPIGIFTWHRENLSSTEGKVSEENALADIDTTSPRIWLAKHSYRLRKLLAGGYRRSPVQYEQFHNGALETHTVRRPTLKIRGDLRNLPE